MTHLRTLALIAAITACSPATPEIDNAQSSSAPPAAQTNASPADTGASMVVYKNATCGCCNDWVAYMRDNGFRVITYDVSDLDAVKQKHDIAANLQACHTAEVGGYFVEGHVPAELVRRLLAERPPIAGIAVPGMPVGSPGMEGGEPQPYDILSVDSTGRTKVFARRP